MLKKFFYITIVALLAVQNTGCNESGDKGMPDLSETYSKKDMNPFGAYIAYRAMEEMYSRNVVRDENGSFEDAWDHSYDSNSIFVNIANGFWTTDEDVDGIVSAAVAGNDIFISAARFDLNLLGRLGCEMNPASSAVSRNKVYRMTNVAVSATGKPDSTRYSYYYHPLINSFTYFDTTDTRVIGVNELNEPNMLVVFRGKGRIFLQCEPRAFSNYFLLQKKNYEYLQKAFGYLISRPEHIYWNEYYTKVKSKTQAEKQREKKHGKRMGRGNDGYRNYDSGSSKNDFSTTGELMKRRPLAIAFWLTLLLLLLYIVFSMKRRQRVLEEVKPNENTTVTFTETIGRLYLQKKDNRNIADKMITYFNEHVRNNYYLNTSTVNREFVSTLSRKSGVALETVQTLYDMFSKVQQKENINDLQLMTLNEQIQKFYKNSVRT